MGSSNKLANPQRKPLPAPSDGSAIVHQTREWASGTRGGGSVPKDFGWGTNPKQHQEERGAAEADKPIS
jgi:hypothetical protein